MKRINDLIKELQEIQAIYGNIESYNIEFYIESNGQKEFLTI